MAGWYSSRGGWWLYLVRLEDRAHEGLVGAWFLEAGFGPCAATTPPPGVPKPRRGAGLGQNPA